MGIREAVRTTGPRALGCFISELALLYERGQFENSLFRIALKALKTFVAHPFRSRDTYNQKVVFQRDAVYSRSCRLIYRIFLRPDRPSERFSSANLKIVQDCCDDAYPVAVPSES
eukprot:2663403-Pyramimonas_sp.AAC.2